MAKLKGLLAAVTMVCVLPGVSSAKEIFIAGVNPQQRPANAPTVTTVKKTNEWYKKALTGVVPPYPYSLHFLENQGNWFNPFMHPGMTGPYDIRGWHKAR